MKRCNTLSWLLGILFAPAAFADLPVATPSIELIGVTRISGEMSDASGIDRPLEDGSPANRFGGLSAIDYSADGDRFVLLSDRGAGDGAVSYPCRFHTAALTVDPETKQIRFQLIQTNLLTSPVGKTLDGSLVSHQADLKTVGSDWTALDPEGIRYLPDGNLLISDEYGPRLVTADPQGRVKGEYAVPDSFRLRLPRDGQYEQGAFPNRGLEGVAVTPSRSRVLAVLQSPMIQDGRVKGDKCYGLNCRWLLFHADGQVQQELNYRMGSTKTGVSEVLAVDEHRFLVLERDGEAGREAKFKKVFLADIADASDIAGLSSLPKEKPPKKVASVRKSLWLDILDDSFGLGGSQAAEKPEGLCWGKPLPDGRRTLWICCDNDFDPNRTSDIYCFAVSDF